MMFIPPAITSFFAALRGPDPTDVPAQIQELLDNNAAQQDHISTLELDVIYYQTCNAALHANEQATQKDISETLAIADKLVKPHRDSRWVDEQTRKAVPPWKQYCASVVQENEKLARQAEAWGEQFAALNTQVAALVKEMQQKFEEVAGVTEQSEGEVERLREANAALEEEVQSTIDHHMKDKAELAEVKWGMEEWKSGVRKANWKWQMWFMAKTRMELAEKCIVGHRAQVERLVKEKHEALIAERDGAVQAKEKMEGEMEMLKQDLAGEQFLHRVAIDVTQRLQQELKDAKDGYGLLYTEYVRLGEAAVQNEKVYSLWSHAQSAELWEMHRLQLENAQASREAEIAYNGLAAAYREMLSACDDYKAEVDTTQATVDEMEGRLQAVKARVDALKEQRNVFQQREKVLEEDLLHSKADRDAVLEKLVVALEQKKEALESQLEAWKMVDRLRKG